MEACNSNPYPSSVQKKSNALNENSITIQARHAAGRILLIEAEALTKKADSFLVGEMGLSSMGSRVRRYSPFQGGGVTPKAATR